MVCRYTYGIRRNRQDAKDLNTEVIVSSLLFQFPEFFGVILARRVCGHNFHPHGITIYVARVKNVPPDSTCIFARRLASLSVPLHVYALTSICPAQYIKSVESVFEVIAEPSRRAILSILASSQQSVGEIERQLRVPQPTVSKHLRVLREAGFVESTVDAQRRLYRLKPEPLQEVDVWLAPFRRFWSAHVDALERHLDRLDQSTPTKD